MVSFKIKKLLRLSFVVLLLSSVAACGFHLRGNIPLSDSIKNMYILAPQGTFKDQLEEVISKVGGELAANPGGADVVLNIRRADLDRKVGTLDDRGKVNSYNLRFKVDYSLDDPEGKPIRKLTKLSESRRYDFNPEQVLESESEEAELLSSMEQDIVLRIVRQLATITDYEPN